MVIAAPAPGADKPPNLSGKWTLDKTQSEFARGAPDSLTATITDRGAESVNHMGDMEMRTKLRQDGAKLLEDTTFTGPRGTLIRKSVITLSEDGRALTLDAGYESPDGAFREKIVLDKVD